MSTKYSLVWGDNVHFYQDLMDEENNFYLELRNEFSSTTLKIPPHIWEAIRVHGISFKLADLSDEDIKSKAEDIVKERFDDEIFKTLGSFEEQVENEIERLSKDREKQKDIRKKMKTLESKTKNFF